MICIEAIQGQNFLSLGNHPTKFIFRDATNGPRTTVIVGVSGSGKSTLLDLLCFVLYNKPFRKINKPALVNSVNGRACLGQVWFRSGGKSYEVRRGIKPDLFEIYADGTLMNQDAKSLDYQDILETQILKMDFKSFKQVVLLGSANYTPFMQLSAADRREIVEELLDIRIFSKMNDINKQRLSACKAALLQYVNEIKTLELKIVHEKELLEKDNSANEALIASGKEQIKKLEEEIVDLEAQFKITQVKMEDLNEKLKPKKKALQNSVELIKTKSKLEQKIEQEEKEISFYEQSATCDRCQQSIGAEFAQEILTKKRESLQKLQQALSVADNSRNILDEKIQKFDELEMELIVEARTLSSIDTSIKTNKREIKKSEDLIKGLSAPQTSEHTTKITELEKELEEKKIEHGIALYEQQTHEACAILLKDTGIKAQIIKHYIPQINALTNAYLQEMHFNVAFEMDEKFDAVIKSRGTDEFSYASFSEGEKQRIDVALLFTWRAVAKAKNSVNINLLFVDEIMDSHLSPEAADNVFNMLSSKNFEGNNIVVISHKDGVGDKFERCIKASKVGGFTEFATVE